MSQNRVLLMKVGGTLRQGKQVAASEVAALVESKSWRKATNSEYQKWLKRLGCK